MAATSGGKGLSLIRRLFRDIRRFSFFQAVRVLECYYRVFAREHPQDAAAVRRPVGYDFPPEQEIVRFRAHPAHSFPPSDLAAIQPLMTEGSAFQQHQVLDPPGPGELPLAIDLACLGLTGPAGVLPQHYTTLMLARLREKDSAMRRFFDLFNHRVASLFYRAWEKYRFPIGYERTKSATNAYEPQEDLFTLCLFSLVGLATPGLRNRQTVHDETLLYYGGQFAHRPPNAVSLERMVADYFELPTVVEQFFGQWLYLQQEDRSRLPTAESPLGVNCRLGVNLVIGERVWDVQSKFRIQIGPLSYRDFQRFTPVGDALRPLCQLTRTYVGPELDFDVQPILKGPEAPWLQLSGDPKNGPRLGWNTWIRSNPFDHDVKEPVFFLDD